MLTRTGEEGDVSRETAAKLRRFEQLLRVEATQQNLISRSTLDQLWDRHIRDSSQLAAFAPHKGATWVDVGSGGGLPGVVLAILTGAPILLVEPRRKRAEFLEFVIANLELPNATVALTRIERVHGPFDVVTARAVAPLVKLLGITAHLGHPGTLWVLPKGRSAQSELAEASSHWHYEVRVEPSSTDADSSILLLRNVRAKRKP